MIKMPQNKTILGVGITLLSKENYLLDLHHQPLDDI